MIGYKLRGGGSVISFIKRIKIGAQLFRCKCLCGNEFNCTKTRIIGNNSHKSRYGCRSCSYNYVSRVLSHPVHDEPSKLIQQLIGESFGRLTVIGIDCKIEHSQYKYLCKCVCGKMCSIRRHHLISSGVVSCGCLRNERLPRGSKHHSWNPNLTDQDRNQKRDEIKLKPLRLLVFDRDNYTCQKCKKTNCYLNAHHLDGFHWFIEGRYDLNNLISLCKTCHADFHRRFGRRHNTKVQMDEFLGKEIVPLHF